MLKEKNVLECSDCLLELKPGEGKQSLDGSLLCETCKKDELKAERLDGEEDDSILSEDMPEEINAYHEALEDERLESLEDN